MALLSTQPLTEMSNGGYRLMDKGGRCVGLTALTPSCADFLEILAASAGIPLPLPFTLHVSL